MLRAKRPKEYGDKSKMEISGADGGPVKIEEAPTAIGRKLAFALAIGMRALEKERSAAGEAPAVDPGSGEGMA
jgi:hypothetical protein